MLLVVYVGRRRTGQRFKGRVLKGCKGGNKSMRRREEGRGVAQYRHKEDIVVKGEMKKVM